MTAAQSCRDTWVLTGIVAALALVEACLAWNTLGLARESTQARKELIAGITGFRETTISQIESAHEQYAALRDEIGKARAEAARAEGVARLEALGRAEQRVLSLARRRAAYERDLNVQLAALRAESAVLRQTVDGLSRTLADARGEIGVARSRGVSAGGGMDKLALLARDTARKLPVLGAASPAHQFPFQLTRQRPSAEFEGIRVVLRSADSKQNRYGVQLAAGGRTLGLAERTLNEPLLFYTGGNRRPCELVVEEIGKDAIRGRLTVPAPLPNGD
jgi:hypothetical protein